MTDLEQLVAAFVAACGEKQRLSKALYAAIKERVNPTAGTLSGTVVQIGEYSVECQFGECTYRKVHVISSASMVEREIREQQEASA